MIYVWAAAALWVLVGLLFWITMMVWQMYITVEDLILLPVAIVLGPVLIVCVLADHSLQSVSEIRMKTVVWDWRKK